jgi:hypothetical protein
MSTLFGRKIDSKDFPSNEILELNTGRSDSEEEIHPSVHHETPQPPTSGVVSFTEPQTPLKKGGGYKLWLKWACIVFLMFGYFSLVFGIMVGVYKGRSMYSSTGNGDSPVEEEEMLFSPTENSYPQTRPTIQFSAKYPNKTFFNTDANICEDPYEYACGNFDLGRENEILYIVRHENEKKKHWINNAITQNISYCFGNEGCINAHRFYSACQSSKMGSVDILINKISTQLSRIREGDVRGTVEDTMIRLLIENGITNFVHLTKESVRCPETGVVEWTHYIRPGGVLLPVSSVNLGFYKDLKTMQKEKLTIREWLESFPFSSLVWFGPDATPDDTLYVENWGYFENLFVHLGMHTEYEIQTQLKDIMTDALRYFDAQDCLDKAKLLFPVSLCKLFINTLTTKSDEFSGSELAAPLRKEFLRQERVSTLLVGGCSSLLHSQTQGNYLEIVETQANPYKDWSYDWIHQNMFRKWYKVYDPVYLHFSYPRTLDFTEDPMDWWTMTNAWYDPFHDETVIPPGLVQVPLYVNHAGDVVKFARLGYALGHEIAHGILQKNKVEQCVFYGNVVELTSSEIMADVLGLTKSFEALLSGGTMQVEVGAEGEQDLFYLTHYTEKERRDFFLLYIQTYCSAHPDKTYDFVHSSPRERANLPILLGDDNPVKEFNELFGCSVKYKDSSCRLHHLSRREDM